MNGRQAALSIQLEHLENAEALRKRMLKEIREAGRPYTTLAAKIDGEIGRKLEDAIQGIQDEIREAGKDA